MKKFLLSFPFAIAVGLIANTSPSVAEGAPQEMIEMMNTVGQHVITKVENSPCQNFAPESIDERLTNSDVVFKKQITNQFIALFQRMLNSSSSAPPIFNQASGIVLSKLSECGLANPR